MVKTVEAKFALANTTKDRIPRLPFFALKEALMGKTYDLSIVVVGDKRSQTLNATYRGKTYIPNVLSFPLDEKTGEIFLNQIGRAHV